MPTPSAQLIGAYRVELTPELFAEAMALKYGGLDFTSDQRHQTEEAIREELSNVVLFEVLVSNKDSRFEVGDFGQEGSDQAPYDDRFLNEDGSDVIAEGFDVPDSNSLRLVFFLHFFDPAKPLETSYGQIKVGALQPMPERLRELIPYEPVD